jgi:hypothetical protein
LTEFLKDVLNNYLHECKKRSEIFEELLLILNKLIKYDKEIKEIYDIITPIIDLYCNQHIEVVHLDKITYDKIFKTISKIRINKHTFEIIKTIIFHGVYQKLIWKGYGVGTKQGNGKKKNIQKL